MGSCPFKFRSNIAPLENLENPPESASLGDHMAVSLYNYPYGLSNHSIRIGERLTIISETDVGDFWMVRSSITAQECYIPSDYAAKVTKRWLFTGISRLKAEQLLLLPNNHTGAFMVRKSQSNNEFYSLSVLLRTGSSYMNSVKHYRISCLQNGWFYISPGLTFHSLDQLVDHYSESADGLCCMLREPCFIQGSPTVPEEIRPIPMTIRRPTLNWRDLNSSMIFRTSSADSEDSLVSEGLRDSISSYLYLTDTNYEENWDP